MSMSRVTERQPRHCRREGDKRTRSGGVGDERERLRRGGREEEKEWKRIPVIANVERYIERR